MISKHKLFCNGFFTEMSSCKRPCKTLLRSQHYSQHVICWFFLLRNRFEGSKNVLFFSYTERARYQYHHNNRPEYRPPNHGPNLPYPYNHPNNRPNQWNDRNDNRYNNPRYDRHNSNEYRRDEWRDGQCDGRNDQDNRNTDHRNNRDDKHN